MPSEHVEQPLPSNEHRTSPDGSRCPGLLIFDVNETLSATPRPGRVCAGRTAARHVGVIGVLPRTLLDVIEPGAAVVAAGPLWLMLG